MRQQEFQLTEVLLIAMEQIQQFSNFLKLGHFSESLSDPLNMVFKVIISIGLPYQTFSFIDKNNCFDFS